MPIFDRPLEDALDALLDAMEKKHLVPPENRDHIKELVKSSLEEKFGREKTPASLLTDPLGHKILLQLVVAAQMKIDFQHHPDMRLNFKNLAKDILGQIDNIKDEKDRLKLEKKVDAMLVLTIALMPQFSRKMQLQPQPNRTNNAQDQQEQNNLDLVFERLMSLYRTLYGVTPSGMPLVNSPQMTDSMGISEQTGSRWSDAAVSGIVAELDNITEKNRSAKEALAPIRDAIHEALEDFFHPAMTLGKQAEGPSPSPLGHVS